MSAWRSGERGYEAVKRSKYNKVVNPRYQHGDPRRNEPPLNSIKRIGANWRQRWHATLDTRRFKDEPTRMRLMGDEAVE